MMTHSSRLLLAAMLTPVWTGCHSPCGSSMPFWQDGDCGEGAAPAEDTALVECDIMLEILADGEFESAAGLEDTVQLTATLSNVSGATQTFTVADPCPDGLVTFDGLGDNMDYYGSCLAGDCETYGEPVEYTLASDEQLTITATVSPAGDDCNAPLDAGQYTITGTLPLTEEPQPMICALPARLSLTE